jgi:hypothetical protein
MKAITVIITSIILISTSTSINTPTFIRDGGSSCSEGESLLFIEQQLDLEVLHLTSTRSSCVVKLKGLSR